MGMQDPKSALQQEALSEIAARLGVVAVCPNEVGRERNTVLFYDLGEDENGGPARRGVSQGPFWRFENINAEGRPDTNFANKGKLGLRSSRWREVLEGAVRLALATSRQREYVLRSGGYLAVRESDEKYNDWNREKIAAMKLLHGAAFLGEINFYGDRRRKVAQGEMSVYEEFCGQLVCNGQGAFCVPAADAWLQKKIRLWNARENMIGARVDMNSIMARIYILGGINLIWF